MNREEVRAAALDAMVRLAAAPGWTGSRRLPDIADQAARLADWILTGHLSSPPPGMVD